MTDVSFAEVVPRVSRLLATKLDTLLIAALISLSSLPTSLGSFDSSAVTAARLWFNWRINWALSCNAETRIETFLTVEKMSELWSPRAENAWESFMRVSRI